MSAGPWKFRKREITRALQAAQAAGVEVERLEIEDGKLVIYGRDKNKPNAATKRISTLDRYLVKK